MHGRWQLPRRAASVFRAARAAAAGTGRRSRRRVGVRSARRIVFFAAAAAVAASAPSQEPPSPSSEPEATPPQRGEGEGEEEEKEYTSAQVAAHCTPASAWVSFEGGVYDVTGFVADHPGGADRLLLAAGGPLEPFWRLYRQHDAPLVRRTLAKYRVGRLAAADADEVASSEAVADDPYADDPADRHPRLRVLQRRPFNAETPPEAQREPVTPAALWYVRHHHPVPRVDPDEYRLAVHPGGGLPPVEYTLDELRDLFPRREVTATMVCAGNRRSELTELGETQGLQWRSGAASTAVWEGAALGDVLRASGHDPAASHVWFEALDAPYDASIPLAKAVDPCGDVLLAYRMNGEPIPRDHGFPVRAVVPGHVGARNVKWVRAVRVSGEEAPSKWQRGAPYKGLPPGLRRLSELDRDPSEIESVQELPVQSAITSHEPGAVAEPDDAGELEVAGWAWSGGGRGIVRVDVSADGGRTWRTAELERPEAAGLRRHWAWTQWRASVPPAPGPAGPRELVCKAVDDSYNVQPDSRGGVWNLRGILNTTWHRVPVRVPDEVPEASRQ